MQAQLKTGKTIKVYTSHSPMSELYIADETGEPVEIGSIVDHCPMTVGEMRKLLAGRSDSDVIEIGTFREDGENIAFSIDREFVHFWEDGTIELSLGMVMN